MTRTTREEIELLIRRAGLSLSPAQVDDVHAGWARVEPMLDRIRGEGSGNAAEPAHVFRADAFAHVADAFVAAQGGGEPFAHADGDPETR
jgi:hypothetical protein